MAQRIIAAADMLLRRLALILISGYQLLLSPWAGGGCRFSPSCSEYAKAVFATHAAPVALWFTVRRLLRCHPFCAGGEDPPPPKPRLK